MELEGHGMANDEPWDGKERRSDKNRRDSDERREEERSILDRRSGFDRRGHPLYSPKPDSKPALQQSRH